MKTNPSNGQIVRDDLSWQRFGNCIVQPEFEKQKNGGTKWPVECQCPAKTRWLAWAEIIKRSPNLCCRLCRNEILRIKRTIHGGKGTKLYGIWRGVLARCYDRHHKSYADYGGRGIIVCEEWKTSFVAFRDDMGECPEGLTIGRKNNDGNYEPKNCEWQPIEKQANNKRSSKFITCFGKTQTYSQWGRELGIDKTVIRQRANKSWPPEKILSKDDFRC